MAAQKKLHVKKGDLVRVIAGKSKGLEGKIISVLPEAEPSAPIDAYEAGMPAEIELTPPTGPE